MKLLLDTHLLIRAVEDSPALPDIARELILDSENELFFSVASIWEVAIKRSADRSDFRLDPSLLRRTLLDSDFHEMTITSEQAMAAASLPPLHRDPFDRLLIGQAMNAGILLLTSDRRIARYDAPVRRA